MKPFDLPTNHFEARKVILGESSALRMSKCVEYINHTYQDRTQLEEAINFYIHDLTDAPSCDVESLAKVGFFPWVEASNELDQSLNLIIQGHYKHSYDSFRRAIELVITGAFFTSKRSDYEKARSWMESDRGTPNFKRACKSLATQPYFQDLDIKFDWVNNLLNLYWKLSDVVHVKGIENSFNEISPIYSFVNGIGEPSFSEAGCKPALDHYLLTIKHIAVIVAASNPLLLKGFDMDVKFGLNPPASGFFYPVQSERLLSLIFDKYRPYFNSLVETDEHIRTTQEWFDSLPDISDDEIQLQAERMGFDA